MTRVKNWLNITAVLTMAGLFLSGCMVGPEYDRPEPFPDANEPYYNAGDFSADVNELERINGWWRDFADEQTAELVKQAVENNYNLKSAAARVLQFQAGFEQAGGKLLPEISYGFSRERAKAAVGFGDPVLYNTYVNTGSVSYVLDFFGKLRHAERAAWNDLLASRADRLTVINSLIASVVRARVNISTLHERIAIAQASIESRKRTLEIVERRYENALVGPVDVRLARENLAAIEATEPALRLQLVRAYHSLDVLLANRPGSSAGKYGSFEDFPKLEDVPVGLGVSLLDRRPDIIAAEQRLKATNERIGVSLAQLYPDLTLTGTYGFRGDHFEDAFNDNFEIYSFLMRLAAPIWKGGQLRAGVREAKARYEQAAADYASAVFDAMQEVEDALAGERYLAEQVVFLEERLSEARQAEELSRSRYGRGLERILTLLESERRRINAENELAVLKGSILNNRVNLYLALGGRWYDEGEPELDNSNK